MDENKFTLSGVRNTDEDIKYSNRSDEYREGYDDGFAAGYQSALDTDKLRQVYVNARESGTAGELDAEQIRIEALADARALSGGNDS